jgi:hypothetical protein
MYMKRLIRVGIFTLELIGYIAMGDLILSAINALAGTSVPWYVPIAISYILLLLLLWPMLPLHRRLWRWLVKKGVAEPRHIDGGLW